MSVAYHYVALDDATRVEISTDAVTHMSRAVVQTRCGTFWISTGFAGVGNGRRDALRDLHGRTVDLANATYNAFRYHERAPQ